MRGVKKAGRVRIILHKAFLTGPESHAARGVHSFADLICELLGDCDIRAEAFDGSNDQKFVIVFYYQKKRCQVYLNHTHERVDGQSWKWTIECQGKVIFQGKAPLQNTHQVVSAMALALGKPWRESQEILASMKHEPLSAFVN